MAVTLAVRYPDFVITAVEAEMRTVPYGVCAEALPGMQALVGLRVGPGFSRAVHERIGRDRGCTHLAALVLALGPVVRQAAGAAFGFGSGRQAGERPWFIGSCQAWREGGPLHRQWLARRREG